MRGFLSVAADSTVMQSRAAGDPYVTDFEAGVAAVDGTDVVLETLEVDPDRGLFVGDSDGDAEAARRAGVAFRWVDARV